MIGDGELQEGQNWEALQAAAHQRVGDLVVVVDRNELQSDKPTEEILALGDLEAKLAAFGWRTVVMRRARHRRAARGVRRGSARTTAVPKLLVAAHDQGPRRLVHGASPGPRRRRRNLPLARRRARRRRPSRSRGRARSARRVGASRRAGFRRSGRSPCRRSTSATGDARGRARERRREPSAAHASRDEYVANAYGEARARARRDPPGARRARRRPRVRLPRPRLRGRAYPDRFVENGIAEQDMVSMAARNGPARAAAGRQLLCELPRLARQRADLQPGERALEGDLRAALRRAHPRRAGEVASEPARRLAARRDPRDHRRAPVERRPRRGRSCAGRSRRRRRASRSGSRSAPHPGSSSCRRVTSPSRAAAGSRARGTTPSSSPTAP